MICAIDIGGTKIAGALIDEENQIVSETYVLTHTAEDGPTIAAQAVTAANSLQKNVEATVQAVGISTGGQIDLFGQIIGGTDMIPNWVGLPLREMVHTQTGRPTFVLNDGHAAALAESILGAGRGQPSMLCIVIGTGLGGGLVIDGQIQHGRNGLAGSIGQLKVTRDGQRYEALEMVVSGPALITTFNQRVRPEEQVVDGRDVARLVQTGHVVARQVVDELGQWLGLGLSHALHMYDAASVVVGGRMDDH